MNGSIAAGVPAANASNREAKAEAGEPRDAGQLLASRALDSGSPVFGGELGTRRRA